MERNLEDIQKNLILRVISAIIGASIFLLFLYIGGLLFKILVILIAILGLLEYFKLVKNLGFRPFKLLTILASIILISFSQSEDFLRITLIVFIALFIIFILSIPFYYSSGRGIEDGAISIYGFLYLSIPSAIFVKLRSIGIEHTIYILGTTWTNDIFAFLIGKFFGRHKIAQNISPNKTIEGFIGGVLFSIIFAILFSYFFHFPTLKYVFFSIILSITGTIGDLTESVIKREAKVKDSGLFLPGHGGVLDRVDSLIVNIPVYFILSKL
ncbi:MAG: phosphatidate cytidylyltransferase [candidate division WOR-3 bacterium]